MSIETSQWVFNWGKIDHCAASTTGTETEGKVRNYGQMSPGEQWPSGRPFLFRLASMF